MAPLEKWLVSNRSYSGSVDLRLFCFPYAGGSALIYRDWAKHLPSAFQVLSVELPGRGSRLAERPLVNLPALVDALADVMNPLLDLPYAFFGHSMGALIAFELARTLRREKGNEPRILFASGRRAPQNLDVSPVTYSLPRDELIMELQRLEGTPREVLEHTELIDLMLPAIRADFQVTQTYKYEEEPALGCPITVFGGLGDREETRRLLGDWKHQTTSRFSLHMLPGDHFFLNSSQAPLLQLLARELTQVLRQRS